MSLSKKLAATIWKQSTLNIAIASFPQICIHKLNVKSMIVTKHNILIIREKMDDKSKITEITQYARVNKNIHCHWYSL